MAINVYMGRAGTGKSYACYEDIKRIRQDEPGDEIILLVPDSATYKTERELAMYMPEKGFATVRVVGFGRLAYQVFQSLGKKNEGLLSEIGQKLILRLLMKRQAGELEMLGQVARQPHFGDVLQTLMTELEAFQVTAEDLAKAEEAVESMALRKKLHEIGILLTSYETLVGESFTQADNRLTELMKVLPQSPLTNQCHVFIDGFHWFTPLQFELVHTLIGLAKETTITITMPTKPVEIQRHSKRGALFNRPWEIYAELQERYGSALQMRTFERNQRFQDPLLAALEQNFFQLPIKRYEGTSRIQVTEGYNREREVDAVCRQILSLVEEKDLRWRDLTIMLRESETYGDILEKQLTRYEIPFFSDRRQPIVTHPLAELVNGLFEVVQRRFDHDVLFRLLKTDFFPVTRQAVDELENYCLEFGLREFAWLRPEWSYLRRGLEEDEAELARRSRVEETRQVIMSYLQPWWDWIQKEHRGYDWCAKLYELIVAIGVPHRLQEWVNESDFEETKDKAAHVQMYKQFISFLDEVMQVDANLEAFLSLEEMALLVEEGLADMTYSLVPPTLDHVTVTTIERGYTRECEYVFLLGINEGVFPQRMGDEGLLKDREREALKEVGLTLAGGALVQAFNEQFLFYLATTRARKGLYISYASSGEEGAGLEPSLVLTRLLQAGYGEIVRKEPLLLPEEKATEYLWRPQQSLTLLAHKMSDVAKGQSIHPLWWSLYEWARTNSVYGGALYSVTRGAGAHNYMPIIGKDIVEGLLLRQHSLTGSVTRLERYQSCPFSFFAQYALRLEPRKVKKMGAPEIGTFLHENLRVLGERLLANNQQWRDISEDERARICHEVAADMKEEVFGQIAVGEESSRAMQEALQDRLEATLVRTVERLTEWSKRSAFNTVAVEMGFGQGYKGSQHQGTGESQDYGTSNPPVYIPLGGDLHIRLQGQIDRIDEWTSKTGQPYGLVIDYKSGHFGISASDVYYGLKLQLVTYLLALENRQGLEPAALVYTTVKNNRISAKSLLSLEEAKAEADADKEFKNSGYFCADPEVLRQIDEMVGPKSTPYVPLRLKQDGTIYSQDKSKVKDKAQFGVMTNYARRVMQKAGEHIVEGHFPISPYNKEGHIPCSYCQYKTVCRFEQTDPDTAYRYIPKLSEEEGLAKMEEGGKTYEVDR